MKRTFIVIGLTLTAYFMQICGCKAENFPGRQKMSLAGEWSFRIDPDDKGIMEEWFNDALNDKVRLPGSMAENGKGDEVTVDTKWTGDIFDKSYFTQRKYERYRQPGNIKIPFWLKPVKYYKGAAWYQKEVIIPEEWNQRKLILLMEQCHWESMVFVNGKEAGRQNSLSVPHKYDLTGFLVTGKNIITVRIDNRVIIPIGVNSHSISDHTQSNWNGIAGNISIEALPVVSIGEISVFPDVKGKKARVIVPIDNSLEFNGVVEISAESHNSPENVKVKKQRLKFSSGNQSAKIITEYPMGNKPLLWSEFNPALYSLKVILKDSKGRIIDQKSVEFGMREFTVAGTRFAINGTPVFLRGTTECCIFPLTGYPPSDVSYWERILKTCKDYGLNHMRFHSYCPPEAAFIAADRLGIYFHVECGSWANQGATVGDGRPVDKFIYEESDRIVEAYGNHPSFCMLAYGNEPSGRNQKKYLGDLINYWKAKDNRRVYTSGAGWPIIPENDYNLTSEPRIQHWGQGVKSIINASSPQTMFDYRDFVSQYTIPTVSHETGQWCVYPDFSEIARYTGPLKATNFEIFRETLVENGMGAQAGDFLTASGKLQVLCYKADIEAALRTPGFAGFQILQLHDFPGQGSALVGILNPFFESKGYVTPAEFSMFCNSTVPLARMEKEIISNREIFRAAIEVAHFGPRPLSDVMVLARIINSDGAVLQSDSMMVREMPVNNCITAGYVEMNPGKIVKAQKLTLEVRLKNTGFMNKWDIWVYPETKSKEAGAVLVTDRFDSKTEETLRKGGSVLLLTYGKLGKEKGAGVITGFSSIFWNTAWTNNQPPHTLGILVNPRHPLFNDFPTEFHSNWQWWDPVSHAQPMILNDFPKEITPLVQLIDTWFENRKLGLVVEAKSGGGKVVVCSIDMKDKIDERPVTKQLMNSILGYMNSADFNPGVEAEVNLIKGLME